jgi:hypothetical protein
VNIAITISAGGNSLLCSLAFQRRLILLGQTFDGNNSVKQKILGSGAGTRKLGLKFHSLAIGGLLPAMPALRKS